MRLRTVPHLKFLFDESIKRGSDLSRLIDEALAGEQNQPEDD